MTEFFKQYFADKNNNYSVVIEDDGKVCYGYLLYGNDIVADVWLYNQSRTPNVEDWDNKDAMPFLNPKAYVDEAKSIEPFGEFSLINLEWEFDDDGMKSVSVYLEDQLLAILRLGCKPSWSKLAKKDGPLALKLKLNNVRDPK